MARRKRAMGQCWVIHYWLPLSNESGILDPAEDDDAGNIFYDRADVEAELAEWANHDEPIYFHVQEFKPGDYLP
jgi:hypothetical protein